MKKRPSKHPLRAEPREEEAFAIDDEAKSFAEEFIAEATSAEHVAEHARDELLDDERHAAFYGVDFTALDELEAP